MSIRKKWFSWFCVLLGFVLIFSITCKKKDPAGPGTDDEHAAWFPPSVDLEVEYKIWDTPFDSYNGTAKILGLDSQTYPGETYVKLQIGTFRIDRQKGVILWLDLSTIDKIGYKAAELYNWPPNSSSKALDKSSTREDWYLKEVYDTPLYVEYDGEEGETKTSATTGTFYFNGDITNFDDLSVSAQYTYTSLNASVTVPYGTVTGCIQMDANYTITDSFGPYSFTGQYFMRPDLGIVKAETVPGFYKAELMNGNSLLLLMSAVF